MAGMGGPFKVFVGGLPQDCTNDILVDYFGKFGNITDVVVMTDRETGRSRGFGFVSYDTEEAVEAIMAMHTEHKIQEKWIDCKRATAEGTKGVPQKGGGRGASGPPGGGRPGDWTCPGCYANVFGSKDSCFKCGTPKSAAGACGGYGGGYGGGGAGGGYRGPSYNAAPPPDYSATGGGYGGASCGGGGCGGDFGCGAYDYGGAYGAGAYGGGACGGDAYGAGMYGGCSASYAPSKGRPGCKGGGKGYAPY